MKTDTTRVPREAAEGTLFVGDDWFDPLEAGVRTHVRGFIEGILEAELDAALGRDRYERPRVAESGQLTGGAGHRHGHRERQLMGTFGPVTVRVPRARLDTSGGKTVEWKNATIPAYQRRTKCADALIAGAYLAGTNTRRDFPRAQFRRLRCAVSEAGVPLPTCLHKVSWRVFSRRLVFALWRPAKQPYGRLASSKQVDAQCQVSTIHTEFSPRQEGRLAAYGKRLRVLLAVRSRWRSLYPGGCSSETPGT